MIHFSCACETEYGVKSLLHLRILFLTLFVELKNMATARTLNLYLNLCAKGNYAQKYRPGV
jgi:hypothetical protein